MAYTAYNNLLVEKKIEQDISSIKEEIIRERKRWGIISLILYGGFARGEGSVVVDRDNVRPLNDYDFLAVTSHPIPRYQSFRKFIEGLDTAADGYKVDAVLRPLWFMKKVRPSVFYYEIKNSGKILWGEDVLSFMPEILPDKIPLSDGICTLFNRLMSLSEAYGVEDRRLVIYQCNKAVLTCIEMLLLQAKRYHWSYRERLSVFSSIFKKSFPGLYRDFPEFIDIAERATWFKLIPDFSLYPEEDLWEKAAVLYFRIINFYISEFESRYGEGREKWFEVMGTTLLRTITSWSVFRLRKVREKDFSWHFSFRSQPYLLTYLAAYEWLKAWVEKAPSCGVRKYLSAVERIEYTDDFLFLKDKIIHNWKKSSFIL